MAWNLFLAAIPLLFSKQLNHYCKKGSGFIIPILLIGLWLLFFPNSPYIITDFFHFHQRPHFPLWYDLILLLSFAWNGVLLGFLSLIEVEKFLSSRTNKFISKSFTVFSLLLSGYGIYLGRFARFNSWDIITNPADLGLCILNHCIHPLRNLHIIEISVGFALLLLMIHYSLLHLTNLNKNEQGKN